MPNEAKTLQYDLEERSAQLGESIIKLCNKIPKSSVTSPLITQLVKCGTSVGANYCEADDAESPQDFKHKIGICKKEAREVKHFLRMINAAVPEFGIELRKLYRESKELHLIFNAIYKKVKKKK
jgi:four helix bundle protein